MAMISEKPTITSGADLEEEIDALRKHFKEDIRILSSIGHFSYILKIRADQYDISLTLQLDRECDMKDAYASVSPFFLSTESYPCKAPDIIITAPRLTPDQILLVQQLLQSYSESLVNRPMVLSIHSRLLQWFDENKIQTLSVNMNNVTPALPSSPRSPTLAKLVSPFGFANNQTRISQHELNDHEQIKPCSTKTIEDVLVRLEEDHRLDKRYIRVGFLDRLLGLQEKSYQELDWQTDPSAIHERSTLTFVISKCSIQYLKYGNETIWDKEKRLDLILGSNSNQQILDNIINRHRNLLESMNSPL